jgi:hypothetical protein
VKFVPHDYQKEGIRFLVSRREGALLVKPGKGKTAQALAAFKTVRKHTAFRGSALVLAPLRVCYDVWSERGELGKWDQFQDLRAALLHGPKRDVEFTKDADLYVINYEGLGWLCSPMDALAPRGLRNPTHLEVLISRGLQYLVIDELSKFKHPKTKRFKSLVPYLSRFAYRWGLTGSPSANSLENLFGECYVLDQGKRLGRYITHFRQRFFIPCGYNGKEWRPAPGAEPRIYEAIKDLAYVITSSDSNEPELVTNNSWVDLPPKARQFYDTLEAEMIAEIDGNVVVAGSAGVVSGKCRQIASGGIYAAGSIPQELQKTAERIAPNGFQVGRNLILPSTGGSVQHIHDAKTEALVDLVDELQGQPLMVGFEFKHDRARIRKALGNVPSIDGDCNPAFQSAIIADWNAGKTPVLLIHPQAGGHGLNLQGCSCANFCFYTCPWDRELYDQVIARVCRQGSKADSVVVHRLLARGTVDELVVRTLGVKGKTQEALFDALREYAAQKRSVKCK